MERELCQEDNGPRRCCGTAQLGPHGPECQVTPGMRDAMRDHEMMFRHEHELTWQPVPPERYEITVWGPGRREGP